MEYRKLGRSGLNISAIGIGANTFGWYVDQQASFSIINHALDMGINYIDTADWYSGGRSEKIVGKAIKDKRSQVIIATKFGLPMGEGTNERGGSRYYIMKAIDASLKRLQTDYIDLYQIHAYDSKTPLEETLRTLNDLVRAGKVRYIGCCNYDAWQVCEALWASRVYNLESFITVQPSYNMLEREIEHELVPFCKAYGIGVIPWGPLAGGFLTGKYKRGQEVPVGTRFFFKPRLYSHLLHNEAFFDKLDKLQAFAAERGHSVSELAIAWLLAHPWVTSVIAGATKLEQLCGNVKALEWKLSADEMAQLDDLDKPESELASKYRVQLQDYRPKADWLDK